MPLVTRMAELQANMRGNQWHARVQNPVEKRTPYIVATGIGACSVWTEFTVVTVRDS
jgi:hypothetical protein